MKTLNTFFFITFLFFSIMFGIMTIDAINGFIHNSIISPLLGVTCSKITIAGLISYMSICSWGTYVVYKIRN